MDIDENWEELYQHAVRELDFQKIVATRDAIAGRLHQRPDFWITDVTEFYNRGS
jgi:hypothetical protein